MNQKPITIFRGDDTDALGYQTIVATLKTTLSLEGCSAVFKFMDFTQTFATIPADNKLTITIPAAKTKEFPPGLSFASLRVTNASGKVRTFDNKIPVCVIVNTPGESCGDVTVEWNTVPQLLGSDNFDMLSTDWELRQLVTKLAKYFGLTVTNETLPE